MNNDANAHHYSPSAFVSRRLPPTPIVLAKDAEEFCAQAAKVGARCELHMYPGVGHLLTRNLTLQYKDFDSDPAFAANAHQFEDTFWSRSGIRNEAHKEARPVRYSVNFQRNRSEETLNR